MEGTKKISRQEFLRCIPKYVMKNVRSLLPRRLDCSEDRVTERLGENSADITAARVVQLDEERCLAWGGGNCQFCYLVCPLRDEAITMDGDQRPAVNHFLCNGCGQCVTACQTVNDRPAVRMVASRAR